MLGESRLRLSEAASLSRRLATSLGAGVDIRRVFAREALGRGSGSLPMKLEPVAVRVQQGYSLADALRASGDYFPPLFREMVELGEQTGRLPEVFSRLAEHYESQVALRRTFRASITWPLLQLGMALGIVGLLIWILGVIGSDGQSPPIDVLGFRPFGKPLVGNHGLLVYLTFVAGTALVLFAGARLIRRSALWGRPLEWLVLALPVIGRSLRTLALARFAWALDITLGAGMPVIEGLQLSLRATQSPGYRSLEDEVARGLKSGREVHEVLADSRAFPREFLDAIEVGERSGRLPETMAVVAVQYNDQARHALAVLTTVAGFAVWALVAGLIILMVFRIFLTAYLGPINEALKGI